MNEHEEPDGVASARGLYDAMADRYVDFAGTELGPATEGPIDLSLLQAFVELVAARPAGLVADVGCGPGRVAAFLARYRADVAGVDVSTEMLVHARAAHPGIAFEEGRLDSLPFADASLAGAVCWYSIIYTPPAKLDSVFTELARVLEPGGQLLLAFQEGDGEALHRRDAYGTGLALTSYRHGVHNVEAGLEAVALEVHATARRAPALNHETATQAFVFARRSETAVS